MPETAAPRRPRARKSAEAAAVDEAAEELARTVNGLNVVADNPVYSHLPTQAGAPPITFRGLRVLTLEDQSEVYACVNCDYVGTRGEVQIHRSQEHGAGKPGRRRQDPGIPAELLAMTLAEVLHLGAGIHGWEALFEQQAAEAAGWKDRALTAEAEVRSFQRLLGRAGYAKVDE